MPAVTDTSLLEAVELRGVNPIRVIRDATGLSLRDAADEIGCHHQALYMCECGTYPHVLPVILNWCSERSGIAPSAIQGAYTHFKLMTREKTKELFAWDSIDLADLGKPGDNPIVEFRKKFDMSRAGMAKRLCIPVAKLYSSENPDATTLMAHMPAELIELLIEMGVQKIVLDEMIERYQVWYDNVR